jgi:unsaturated rhamnogalacturonyl hydrolase
MSVLYTLACLIELDDQRGGILTPQERQLYDPWLDEWAEWVMNELPSESAVLVGADL